jgi:hypothetical protein
VTHQGSHLTFKLTETRQAMSDMLQLVVEAPYAQLLSPITVLRKKMNLPQPDDKLKRIGHLVDAFLLA